VDKAYAIFRASRNSLIFPLWPDHSNNGHLGRGHTRENPRPLVYSSPDEN
jgi:hypothetical protein